LVTLEKIEIIREKTGVTYKEAKAALEKTGGDVVDALIYIEEMQSAAPRWKERVSVTGNELLSKVRELLHEGNVTRIVVKQNEQTIVEIPVTVAAVGAILGPAIAALGVIAALVSRCTIEIERKRRPDDGEPDNPGPMMNPE